MKRIDWELEIMKRSVEMFLQTLHELLELVDTEETVENDNSSKES